VSYYEVINLASKAQTESSSSSSKTYLLVVPTVAPSNSEQSKRQAVGNLISEKNRQQYFHFLEEDQQQKTLKRKVPTTVSPLSASQRLSHLPARQKEIVQATQRSYTQQEISVPQSNSSANSSGSSSSVSSFQHQTTPVLGPSSQSEPEAERPSQFDANTVNQILLPASQVNNSEEKTSSVVVSAVDTNVSLLTSVIELSLLLSGRLHTFGIHVNRK